mmetsp:Transcript_2128/g.5510  ORF Transcript_2128/g.5510 Transcript_2128/m.5510 type:complete len:215 (+) Transcript_2128:1830-2474(+)
MLQYAADRLVAALLQGQRAGPAALRLALGAAEQRGEDLECEVQELRRQVRQDRIGEVRQRSGLLLSRRLGVGGLLPCDGLEEHGDQILEEPPHQLWFGDAGVGLHGAERKELAVAADRQIPPLALLVDLDVRLEHLGKHPGGQRPEGGHVGLLRGLRQGRWWLLGGVAGALERHPHEVAQLRLPPQHGYQLFGQLPAPRQQRGGQVQGLVEESR